MLMVQRLTIRAWALWNDRRAQDLVEYALAAAFVAVTCSAFFPPSVAPAISTVFSKVGSVFALHP